MYYIWVDEKINHSNTPYTYMSITPRALACSCTENLNGSVSVAFSLNHSDLVIIGEAIEQI